ncbi:hypothetical protein FJU08_08260 [Martelella alba]|uniref:Endonuclease/exonuclease/phosphatase domain-containing protein n=1 Tax=Martelella alba TaxID=2590451 RepID=A0A506UE90_9HYPH|nr:endonuclease/exonuclease/phosphatase family protein [Martelella alba]TPW31726.1 hypothetical protein FJU08_08260 [Martelella alba]
MKTISTLLSASALLALILCVIPVFSNSWFFSFIGGMRLHLAIFALILSLLLLATGQWPNSIVPLGLSLAMLVYLNYLGTHFEQPVAVNKTGPKLKVVEFNILESNTQADKVAAFLQSADADIAFILEAGTMASHLPQLSKTYPYRLGCGEKTQTCDLLILSRHPLQNAIVTSIGKLRPDRYMQARITVSDQTVTVIGMHLTKPYYDDFHIDELQTAGQRGWRQSKEPVIVAGDFNSSILAGDMQRFLRVTGLRTAAHQPKTWPVAAPSLGLAIDHIFVRPPAHIDRLQRIEDNLGSNHYGLTAEISIGESDNAQN